jgi:hypothetical protein
MPSPDVLALNPGLEAPARQRQARKGTGAPRDTAAAPGGAQAALEVCGLPLPPSLNNAYVDRDGRRRLSGEGARYKRTAARLVAAAVAAQGFTVPPRTPLRLTFRFWFARNNRDGSNTPKLLEDAVSDLLGFNDIWVWEMTWTKAIDKDNPRCDMRLEVMG